MKTLYVKTGCPYCAKVLKIVEEQGIPVTIKNIADPGVAAELVLEGGKRQVPFLKEEEECPPESLTPCLIDHENDLKLYESDAIVDYLSQHS
jgi:glutathione S-transferase